MSQKTNVQKQDLAVQCLPAFPVIESGTEESIEVVLTRLALGTTKGNFHKEQHPVLYTAQLREVATRVKGGKGEAERARHMAEGKQEHGERPSTTNDLLCVCHAWETVM